MFCMGTVDARSCFRKKRIENLEKFGWRLLIRSFSQSLSPELSQSFGDLALTQRDASPFDVFAYFFLNLLQLSFEFRTFACAALPGH